MGSPYQTIRLERDATRYFLAHPIDIGAGGIRFSHRLPLQAGDQFRLLLRLKRVNGVLEGPAAKFLGEPQSKYEKKNWSSVILFNNARCTALTPEYVSTASGLELHQFKWLDGDEQHGA